MPGKAKKIAILNSDPEILVNLRGVLVLCGYSVCGATTECSEISRILQRQRVDLLIVDLLPAKRGYFSAIKRWHDAYPALPIVAYCTSNDAKSVQRAMLSGVRFCVFRTQPLETFIGIVRDHLSVTHSALETGRTKSPKCPEVTEDSNEELSVDAGVGRELEIFKLLGQGYARKEIAEKLFISPRTVDAYLARLKNNLGISSCRELLRLALQANQTLQSKRFDNLHWQLTAAPTQEN